MEGLLTDLDSRTLLLFYGEVKRCMQAKDFDGATALFRAN
jgi:hypothetical protein